MSDELTIRVREEFDHIVLRLSGRLSLRTIPQAREIIVKSLLSTGRVVINVSLLRSSQSAFVSVFPTALAAAGGWPSARLVLFGAKPDLRSMLISTRTVEMVPLVTDLGSAVAILAQRPPQVRCRRELPCHKTAALAARGLVRQACQAWQICAEIQEVAELVATELVTNAVEHAHSSSQLVLTCTRTALGISVRDYRPTPVPRPRPIDLDAPRGRGLHLVARLAQSWGVEQHPDGKTIWAHLEILGL